MQKEAVRQIIIRIKEVIRDMPDAEVQKRMLDAGEQTSISTIRRIKAEGSEDAGFNYDLTLKRFARVFLGISNKPIDIEALDTEEEKDRAAIENMLLVKNYQLEAKDSEILSLKSQLEEQKSGEQRKVSHLQGQIEGLNKILDDRKEFIADYRERIVRLEKEKEELRERYEFEIDVLGSEKKELTERYESELTVHKKFNRWVLAALVAACFLALVLPPLIPLFS